MELGLKQKLELMLDIAFGKTLKGIIFIFDGLSSSIWGMKELHDQLCSISNFPTAMKRVDHDKIHRDFPSE